MQGIFNLAKKAKAAISSTLTRKEDSKTEQVRPDLLKPKRSSKEQAIANIAGARMDTAVGKLNALLTYYQVRAPPSRKQSTTRSLPMKSSLL